MRYIACFIFLVFPVTLFAEGGIQFSVDRPVIYKKETATFSWNVPSAISCNSYVDVLDSHGKWVWQFSDTWQNANRPIQGTFEAKPADDARYYLECMIEGQKSSKYEEVQVLDRDKYISGDETPNVPVISTKPAVLQDAKKVSEPQKPSNAKSGGVPTADNTTATAGGSGGTTGGSIGGGGSNISALAINSNKSPVASENLENKGNTTNTQKNIEANKDGQESNRLREKSAQVSQDSDFDLLSDEEEVRIGTDPNNPDTDGDGYLDGLEVKSGYSPLVRASKKEVKKPAKAPTVKKQPVKKTIQKTKIFQKKAKKVLNTKKKTPKKTPKPVDKKTRRQ